MLPTLPPNVNYIAVVKLKCCMPVWFEWNRERRTRNHDGRRPRQRRRRGGRTTEHGGRRTDDGQRTTEDGQRTTGGGTGRDGMGRGGETYILQCANMSGDIIAFAIASHSRGTTKSEQAVAQPMLQVASSWPEQPCDARNESWAPFLPMLL